jgi:hypothetical protein
MRFLRIGVYIEWGGGGGQTVLGGGVENVEKIVHGLDFFVFFSEILIII